MKPGGTHKAIPLLKYLNSSTNATSVQFSRSVVSDSLQPHKPQHATSPCPSPTPGVHPNSCSLSRWCHPTISSSVIPFSTCPRLSIRVFSNESALCIRWPMYWSVSFNLSPSNEHSGLISFRMDWLDLLYTWERHLEEMYEEINSIMEHARGSYLSFCRN